MQAKKQGARRSPLVKAPTSSGTFATHTHEYGMWSLAGEAGDHRLAVRVITAAARGAGEVARGDA